jgi:hypothetical protein
MVVDQPDEQDANLFQNAAEELQVEKLVMQQEIAKLNQ